MAGEMVTREDVEELVNNVRELRELFGDLNLRLGNTAGAVETQEVVVNEAFRADLLERSEMIAAIQRELDRRLQTVTELETRVQGIEANNNPEFYASLQRTLEGRTQEFLEQLEPNLIQRSVNLEEQLPEMDEVLTNLKNAIDDGEPARQAEIEARFESVSEWYTGMEHRIQNLETFKAQVAYDMPRVLEDFMPRVRDDLNNIQNRINDFEKDVNVNGGWQGCRDSHPRELDQAQSLRQAPEVRRPARTLSILELQDGSAPGE